MSQSMVNTSSSSNQILPSALLLMTSYIPTIVETRLWKLGIDYRSLVALPDGNGYYATCGPFLLHIAPDFNTKIAAGSISARHVAHDGQATSGAAFCDLVGLTFVESTLYLVDRTEGTIRRMIGSEVSTFCGPTNCNRPCEVKFDLHRPHHIVSLHDKLYVSDTGNNVIRVFDIRNPRNITTIGSTALKPAKSHPNLSAYLKAQDGSYSDCSFKLPVGMTMIRASNTLYVAESTGLVREVDIEKQVVRSLDQSPFIPICKLAGLGDDIFRAPVAVSIDPTTGKVAMLFTDGTFIVSHRGPLSHLTMLERDQMNYICTNPFLLAMVSGPVSIEVDNIDTDPARYKLLAESVGPFPHVDFSQDYLLQDIPDTGFEHLLRNRAYTLSHFPSALNVSIRFHPPGWTTLATEQPISSFCSTGKPGEWLIAKNKHLYLLNTCYEAKLLCSLDHTLLWLERISSSTIVSTSSYLAICYGNPASNWVQYAGDLRPDLIQRDGPRLQARFLNLGQFVSLKDKIYMVDNMSGCAGRDCRIRVLDMKTGLVSSIPYARPDFSLPFYQTNLFHRPILPAFEDQLQNCFHGRPSVLCPMPSWNAILIGESDTGDIRILDTTSGSITPWRVIPPHPNPYPLPDHPSCLIETADGFLIGHPGALWKRFHESSRTETDVSLPMPLIEVPIASKYIEPQRLAILTRFSLQIRTRTDMLTSNSYSNETVPFPDRISFFASLVRNASTEAKVSLTANAFLLGASPVLFDKMYSEFHGASESLTSPSASSRSLAANPCVAVVDAIIRPLFSAERFVHNALEAFDRHLQDYLNIEYELCRNLCNFSISQYQYSWYLEQLRHKIDTKLQARETNEFDELQRAHSCSAGMSSTTASSSSSSLSPQNASSSDASLTTTSSPSSIETVPPPAALTDCNAAPPPNNGVHLTSPSTSFSPVVASPSMTGFPSQQTSGTGTATSKASLEMWLQTLLPKVYPREDACKRELLFGTIALTSDDAFYLCVRAIGRNLHMRTRYADNPIKTLPATPGPFVSIPVSFDHLPHHRIVEVHLCIVCPQWPWFNDRVKEETLSPLSKSKDHSPSLRLPQGFSERLFFVMMRAMHGDDFDARTLLNEDLVFVDRNPDIFASTSSTSPYVLGQLRPLVKK